MTDTPEPAHTPEANWSYVTLKRIREGYTWSIGAGVDVPVEGLIQAMENALAIDAALRQRLGLETK